MLDDLTAARAPEADRLGIPKTGTLRLLIDAKRSGIIPSVRAPLDQLRARGMWLSNAVWREVLTQAEEWTRSLAGLRPGSELRCSAKEPDQQTPARSLDSRPAACRAGRGSNGRL